jgi:hypothetical protein
MALIQANETALVGLQAEKLTFAPSANLVRNVSDYVPPALFFGTGQTLSFAKTKNSLGEPGSVSCRVEGGKIARLRKVLTKSC